MTIEGIRKNAPSGATHYIIIEGIAIYVLKKRFYHRWLHNGEFSQWMYYKPSLFFRLFKIKPL